MTVRVEYGNSIENILMSFLFPLLLTLNLGHNGLMCVWKSCYHYSIGTPRGRFVQDIGWKMENLSTTTGITRFTSGHPHVKQPDLVYIITVRNVLLTTCIQCNLNLVTINLVTTCDLVTILQRPFFILLHKSIWFSVIIRLSDSFCGDQKCH